MKGSRSKRQFQKSLLRGQICIVNSVGKAKLFCNTHQSFFSNVPRLLMLFVETTHRESSHRKI